MLKQVAEAHLCTSFHFVLWEFLCSPGFESIMHCFFLKGLSSVVSTCRKTVEMCTSWIGSPLAIFQMIWKLTIPSLSSWWFAVYYTAVEGVSGFESKAGKWNQPWGVTIEMKASEQVGGGRYSLWWPIRVGSARKGYYLFQASGIWKGRGFH